MTLHGIEQGACAHSLKMLADGTRLSVLRQLIHGARRVGEMGEHLGISQSLLSHHLKVLRESGLVVARRAGKAVEYSLAPGVSADAREDALDLGCCRLSFRAREG